MIVKKSKRWISFLKTTAIGGLLFLLPLIVLGALVSQVAPLVMSIKDALHDWIPVKTPTGIAILILISIAILMLLCFAAGLIAKWSIGQRITNLFEKNVLLLFPRYAIIKEQMKDTMGGNQGAPQLKGALVQFQDHKRIAFETGRSKDGSQVTVYLPGSPDTWAGYVVILDADRVLPLDSTFGETVTTCEQLGRGAFELIEKATEDPRKTLKGE